MNESEFDFRLTESSPCLNKANDGYNMGAYLGIWKEPPPEDSLTMNLLFQNVPNPFNNNTLIVFQIFTRKSSENVKLRVYNVRGQLIRTLVSEPKSSGKYSVYWNGRDDIGEGVNSGIYFCHLQVGSKFSTAIKMVWQKPKINE